MERGGIRDMLVGEIIDRWPDTARDFHRRRMSCPGCVMAPFMTVNDVCSAYKIDEEALLNDLLQSIERMERRNRDRS